MRHSHRRRHRACLTMPTSMLIVSTVLATACGAAAAQVGTPTPAVPAASAANSTADARAQREADKVFQWIRIHSDKPRKAAAAPAERPAAATVKVARPSKPSDSGIAETVQAAPAGAPERPRAPVAVHTEPEPAAVAPTPPREPAVAIAKPDAVERPAPAAVAAPPEDDVALIPLRKTEPEFPANLMRTLRKGVVQVSFTVLTDGTVSEPRVVSASHPRLAPTAVVTVSQWRFQPLRHPQQAVVDLGFNLE